MVTLSSLLQQLQTCGYTNDLIVANYVYEDGEGSHTVQLAGFSSPIRDSRASCISVLCRDNLPEATEEFVYSYRGIGTPVVFVCVQNTVQWWSIKTTGAVCEKTISKNKLSVFFNEHKTDFAPERIWRAKNLGRVDKRQQLHFVDIGLMPLLEHEMGERLGKLMNRVLDLLRNGFTERQLKKHENQRWIFRAGFWLLCAKILRDKGVKNFKRVNLNDIDTVIRTVSTHYRAREQVTIETEKQRGVVEKAANEIDRFSSLQNLTTEAFGYMYENVLVSDELRAALGIHATPSYLVDYIVWQLWPWIKQIPEDKRVVLEPACGHAPFLSGAMRLLRELFEGDLKEFHKYAKRKLIGIEMDPFAREMARLSLTLADIPNPNGWNIIEKDIYHGDDLSKQAKKAMILLSNPPFENFSKDDKEVYANIETGNKAAEVLARTLPNMPDNSVFGIVLPQGFLDRKNLAGLRKDILDHFEIREICNLPDNVFANAEHPSTVLIGRKKDGDKKVSYVKVSKSKLQVFIDSYQAPKLTILKDDFYKANYFSFKVTELKEIWEYCNRYPALEDYVTIGRGIEYKKFDSSVKKRKFPGAVKGYPSFEKSVGENKVDIDITELPDQLWMSLNSEDIKNPRYGNQRGLPQILTSYLRAGRGVWRMRGLLDMEGNPISNKMISVRPILEKHESVSLLAVWALLNSPFANAYMFCHCGRQNLEGVLRIMPVPFKSKDLSKLEKMAKNYFTFSSGPQKFRLGGDDELKKEKKKLLFDIDAEVMRLYDLPPRYEKEILDLFQGKQRKGVDFDFTGYYREGFESAIPLHLYLSEEYQKSTFENVNKWVEENRSDEIIKAFETAVDAFQDE